MTPFSLLLASLLAAIIMFAGSVLIAMVLLERPLRTKLAAKRSSDQAGPKRYGQPQARDTPPLKPGGCAMRGQSRPDC